MNNQEVPTSATLPKSRKWLFRLGAIVSVAFVAFIAFSFYSLFLIFAPDEYKFPAPSGTKTLILSESCFSIACDYTARIEIQADGGTKALDCELGLRGDGSKFGEAVVLWSEDEASIAWEVVNLGGEIDIQSDCE